MEAPDSGSANFPLRASLFRNGIPPYNPTTIHFFVRQVQAAHNRGQWRQHPLIHLTDAFNHFGNWFYGLTTINLPFITVKPREKWQTQPATQTNASSDQRAIMGFIRHLHPEASFLIYRLAQYSLMEAILGTERYYISVEVSGIPIH